MGFLQERSDRIAVRGARSILTCAVFATATPAAPAATVAAAVAVHNISDILGGFLLAIIFTTPFAIKAIGLHGCIQMLIDGPNGSTAAQNGAPTVAQHTAEDTLVLPRIVQDTVPMGTVPGNGGVGVGQAGGGVPKKGLGHGGADHTAVDVAPASLRG